MEWRSLLAPVDGRFEFQLAFFLPLCSLSLIEAVGVLSLTLCGKSSASLDLG